MAKEVTITIDSAREVMYDELADEFGESLVKEDVEEAAAQRLTQLFDNREQLREAVEQAQ